MLFKSFQAVVSNVSLQMRVSSSTFNAEPPIRKPSTSGSLISSTAFFEDTEPPYRIRTGRFGSPWPRPVPTEA